MDKKLLCFIVFLVVLCVWPFLFQKAKFDSDKKLEKFKVCIDNAPYPLDNPTTRINYFDICEDSI